MSFVIDNIFFFLSGKIMVFLAVDENSDLCMCILAFNVKCVSLCGSWLKELEADLI